MRRISNHARAGTAVARLAGRQEGLITRRQLEARGVTSKQIEGWIRDRRLHPVFRTVFVLGAPTVGPRARMRAAALACPGAVISHRSAAALLGLREVVPVVIDLIPPAEHGRKIDGIKAHRVAFPDPTEMRTAYGIPCTTIARTLVDLAGTHGIDKLREAVAMAATKRRLNIAAVEAVLAKGKRRGAPALRLVLDEWRPVEETAKHSTIRSLFEAKLLPLVAGAELPIPKVNARVRTAERILEVDLLWPDQKLALEADSRRHHAIELAFEEDHKRTRELIAANYEVLRVTWREVEDEPDAVFAVLRARLVARGA